MADNIYSKYMKFRKRLNEALQDSNYSKTLFVFSAIFALVYHFSFFIVFRVLNVMPMFYFNIGSVILFTSVLIRSFSQKNLLPLIFIMSVEVFLHQIFADYYMGGNAEFHYLILLVGLLPVLCFGKKLRFSVSWGLVTICIFLVIEYYSNSVMPEYDISSKVIEVIRIINLGCTALVILIGISVYAYIVIHVEDLLELQISQKTNKIYQLQDNIIVSLANLVENRDMDTGKHIQRTSIYVNMLAKKARDMGIYSDQIDDKFIEMVTRAAPLHDIGKIVVSDTILKKPGKLTAEEYNMMKVHTSEGVKIIDEIYSLSEDHGYIKITKDIVGSHHEWWNGNGYPHNLSNLEIPLSARIMAIADVFDALVSTRCYKSAMTYEEAFKILEEESGTHFDPELVKAFLALKDQLLEENSNSGK